MRRAAMGWAARGERRRKNAVRLFVAILFPKNIREELSDSMRRLRAQGVRGNFSRDENLHLTLAFLGETEDLEGACRAVDSVDAAPFRLSFAGSGAFGDILWTGISDSPQLRSCVRTLRAALRERGVWFDSKPFRPHVTLVRRASGAEGVKIPVPKTPFTVSRISLMRSERTEGGRLIYTEAYGADLLGGR